MNTLGSPLWAAIFASICLIALLSVGSVQAAAPEVSPVPYVQISDAFVGTSSATPLQVPAETLTYNNQSAIDTGGNPTIVLADLRPVFALLRTSDVIATYVLGLAFAFSGSRQAYSQVKSREFRDYNYYGGPPPNAVAPVVGSNLGGGIRSTSIIWQDGVPYLFTLERNFRPVNGPGSGANVLVWPYGPDSNPPTTIGLATENSYSNVAQLGDTVPPRPSPTPSGVGTTYTAFGTLALHSDYAAFIANGSAFSGVYTKKASDGVTRRVAESVAGVPYGNNIYEVFFHGNTEVIFRSDNGLYRGHPEGATTPVTIIMNGQQFAPGRIYRSGVLTGVNGDLAAVAGSADNFLSTIFILDLTTYTLQAIVQQGAPIPGSMTGETFSVLQRAGISNSIVVFEAFNQSFQYAGLFAWVDGQVLPIVRKGQMLDGQTILNLGFQPAAVDGDAMAFTAYFTDGSARAYVATIGTTKLNAAVSRKVHGAAGTFDIALPISGTPGVECRSGGAGNNHTIVFGFSHTIVSGNASVTGGTGSMMGSPTFSENTMTVNLAGITDAQTVTLTLTDVTDSSAQVLAPVSLTFGVLLGDTNGNGSVSAADISQTKAQSGFPLTAQNVRQDVNANGSISSSDVALVKSRSGASIPIASSRLGKK